MSYAKLCSFCVFTFSNMKNEKWKMKNAPCLEYLNMQTADLHDIVQCYVRACTDRPMPAFCWNFSLNCVDFLCFKRYQNHKISYFSLACLLIELKLSSRVYRRTELLPPPAPCV